MLNSPVDLALVFGAALLLFGPKKLPEIGKALGQGIGNFKRSMTEAKDEVSNALKAQETPKSAPGEEAAVSSNPVATDPGPKGNPIK